MQLQVNLLFALSWVSVLCGIVISILFLFLLLQLANIIFYRPKIKIGIVIPLLVEHNQSAMLSFCLLCDHEQYLQPIRATNFRWGPLL